MNKDELNERVNIQGEKKHYWHATDEQCSIEPVNEDELNEREYIQGKKNYFWNVIDYYDSIENTMNEDQLNERVNIQGKKNHYWHATDDHCSRVNGSNMCDRHKCNSKCNVRPEVTGVEGTDGVTNQLREIQVQLQNKEVPHESNIVACKDFQKVLQLATGEYINLHGDCDVIFLPGVSNTSMVISKDNYKNINDKEKFLFYNLKQMYIQLEMLKNNSNYSALNGSAGFDCSSALFSGYNVIEVIMKNYMDILYSFEGNGLTSSEIKYQKYFLLFLILPFIKWVINSNMPLCSERTIEVFTEYYCDEIYFEEKLAELKSILALKR